MKLTKPQIDVLRLALAVKLSRSSMGWWAQSEAPAASHRVHSPVKVRALHKRGLLDGNFTFDDRYPRNSPHQLHGGGYAEPKPKNLDGLCHEGTTSAKFQVWTSDLGRTALEKLQDRAEP